MEPYNPNTVNYKNPRYLKNNFIELELEDPELGWIPYTCSPFDDDSSDIYKVNMRLYNRIKAEGNITPYIKPVASYELCEIVAKAKRNDLLFDSDWTQLPDVPQETKDRWASYRQQLRDITKQPGFPMQINWPEVDPAGNPLNIVWPPELD